LVVFSSNTYFVVNMGQQNSAFPQFSDQYKAAVAFLCGPFLINLVLSFYITRREYHNNKDFEYWANKFIGPLCVFVLMGGIKTGNVRISLSKVMGWQTLEAPWSTESDLLLKSLGVIGALFSDLPLGIIMITMLGTNHGYNNFLLFPLLAIGISLVFTLSTRAVATVKLVRHRKTLATSAKSALAMKETLNANEASSPTDAPSSPSIATSPKKSIANANSTATKDKAPEVPTRDSDVLSIGDRQSIPAFPVAPQD